MRGPGSWGGQGREGERAKREPGPRGGQVGEEAKARRGPRPQKTIIGIRPTYRDNRLSCGVRYHGSIQI